MKDTKPGPFQPELNATLNRLALGHTHYSLFLETTINGIWGKVAMLWRMLSQAMYRKSLMLRKCDLYLHFFCHIRWPHRKCQHLEINLRCATALSMWKSRRFWSSKVGLDLISLLREEFSQGYSSVKTSHSSQQQSSDSVWTPAGVCTSCFYFDVLCEEIEGVDGMLQIFPLESA